MSGAPRTPLLLIEPSQEARALATRLEAGQVEVSRAFIWPTPVPGLREPDQMVVCGEYGAFAHDDIHMGHRYSVLLVVCAAMGWRLYSAGRHGLCNSDPAGKGEVLLLDIHKMHALTHIHGRHRDGWFALTWDCDTRRQAAKIERMLREAVGQ